MVFDIKTRDNGKGENPLFAFSIIIWVHNYYFLISLILMEEIL